MLDAPLIETALGLSLLFLVVSLLASGIHEGYASMVKSRARNLRRGIANLLFTGAESDGHYDFGSMFMQHAIIKGMTEGSQTWLSRPIDWIGSLGAKSERETVKTSTGFRFTASAKTDGITRLVKETPAGVVGPSYISGPQFRTILVDILCDRFGLTVNPGFPEQLRDKILDDDKLKGSQFGGILVALTRSAGDNAEIFYARLETWFDDSMERVGGWYTRDVQRRLFIIGIAMAVLGNVDALHIGTALYQNPVMREKASTAGARLSGQLESVSNDSLTKKAASYYLDAQKELDSLEIPMGWGFGRDQKGTLLEQMKRAWKLFIGPAEGFWNTVLTILGKLVGWLVTGLAIAMGAPFWFDLLKRFVNIRSAGTNPQGAVKAAGGGASAASEDYRASDPPKG